MKLMRVVLVLGTVAMLCFPRQAAATEFGSPKSYPVGTNPTAVAIGDFNGDGKPDIAVVNSGSNNISILLGNGDGTFQAAVNSAVSSSGNGPRALAVGDFNGDNKLDLIVVNSGDPSKNIHGALSLLLGKGDGTFQPPVALQAGTFPISVAVADINNNHRLDLLVGDQDAGTISVFLGNGNGTFQAAKTVSLEASGSVNSIVVADFNQDTKPDVVCAIKGGFVVLLGNGDGTFQTPNQVADPVSDIALRIGDFNGDHKVDLLVTNVRRGCLFSDCFDFTSEVLHLGNGDGTFQTGIPVALRSGDSAAADFNGDEKLDLFVTGGSGLLLLGEGNGSFLSVPPPESLPAASAVAAADFSGDGLPDLALTDAANNAVVIVLNTSPASGADLGVTVDPTQANAIVGGNIAYTATILNEGPQDSAVTLTENLPAGWKFVSAQPSQGTCTGATTITCNLGTMPDPSSATVKFAVTPTTAGTSSDSITVSGTQPDLDSKNNSASLSITAALPANVSVAGSASPASGLVGDKVVVSGKVSNAGPATATNVVLTDAVTDGTAVSNLTISQGSCAISSRQITCMIGTLASSAAASLSYTVTLNAPGAFDNALSVSADQPNSSGSTSADVTIPVNPTDLAMAISLSPNPPAPGASVTSKAIITNNGPSAASSASVNIGFLPVNIAIGSIRASQGNCQTPVDGGIACSIGPLAPGASATVTVVVTAPGGGQITYVAGVTDGPEDPNPANNNASMTVNVVTPPDFTVSPSSTQLTVKRGGQATETLTTSAQCGFSGTIMLTCSVSGPAPMPACGISPNSTTAGGSATLTVNAAGLTSALLAQPFVRTEGLEAAWLPLGSGGCVLAVGFDKRRRRRWVLAGFLAILAVACAACGGGGGSPAVKSFTVTVTAVSGSISKSVPIAVTVQ